MPETMEAVRSLLDLRHRGRTEDLPSALAEVAPLLDASEVSVLLIDYEQITLWPLRGTADRIDGEVHVDDTVAGRAFRTAETLPEEIEDGVRLWLPLLHGAERLGVVTVRLNPSGRAPARPVGDRRVVAEAIASRRSTAKHSSAPAAGSDAAAARSLDQLPPLPSPPNDTGSRGPRAVYDAGGSRDYARTARDAPSMFDTSGSSTRVRDHVTSTRPHKARRSGCAEHTYSRRQMGPGSTGRVRHRGGLSGHRHRALPEHSGHRPELWMRGGAAAVRVPKACRSGWGHMVDRVTGDRAQLQPGGRAAYTDGVTRTGATAPVGLEQLASHEGALSRRMPRRRRCAALTRSPYTQNRNCA